MENKQLRKNAIHLNVRKDKGISLVALVITVIVLIIIAGTIIISALGDNGLFTNARKAAFKSDVSQLRDGLVTKKIVEKAENGGVEPSIYILTLSDIDPQLAKKYENKLTILEDGNLYYLLGENGLTPEEETWAIELGLTTILEFRDYVDYIANSYNNLPDATFDMGDIKMRDLTKVVQAIQSRYPDAYYAYSNLTPEGYTKLMNDVKGLGIVCGYINENGISNSTTIQSGGGEQAEWIIAKCNELNLGINFPTTVQRIQNSFAAAQIALTLAGNLEISYDGDTYLMSSVASTEADTLLNENAREIGILMSSTQASQLFDYTVQASSDPLQGDTATITRYKGNATNIEIPLYISDKNGDVKIVQTIGQEAFLTNKPIKYNLVELMDLESSLRNNRSGATYANCTMAELFAVTNVDPSNTGMATALDILKENCAEYEATIANKNAYVSEYGMIVMFGGGHQEATADYIINENNAIYANVIMNMQTGMPTVYRANAETREQINSITISKGIETVAARAFAGQLVTTLYLPDTIENFASDSFTGGSIGEIRTPMNQSEFQAINGFSYYNLFGTGSDWHQIVSLESN